MRAGMEPFSRAAPSPFCPPRGAMNHRGKRYRASKEYRAWYESKPRIPKGSYRVDCIKAEKKKPDFMNKELPNVTLLHRTEINGEAVIIIQRLQIHKRFKENDHYYEEWVTANHGRRPLKPRLNDMPMKIFVGKSFMARVRDHKPLMAEHRSREHYAAEGITDPPCTCGHFEHEHTQTEGCLICKTIQPDNEKRCRGFHLKLHPKKEAYWYSEVISLESLIEEEETKRFARKLTFSSPPGARK